MTARETYRPDAFSMAGKSMPISERCDLLVVGAGPAGQAAAIEGARQGRAVVLVDENPIAAEMMGLDVPLHFGGRAGGAVRNHSAMLEALITARPGIATAFEAGVDVRLATVVWGLYANGPGVAWLPGLVAGLVSKQDADGRASLLGCDSVVVATGCRDMGLGFPGWDLPGVMGLTAACRLATDYGALDARRVVLLGTTAEALAGAATLRDAGIEIVAIVEQGPAPRHPVPDGLTDRVLCGHVIRAAEGRDQVTSVVVGRTAGGGDPIRLACDTILLGIAAVPAVELLDALGCRMEFGGERGGWVPVLDAEGRTSVAGVSAVGDCAGLRRPGSASGRRDGDDVGAYWLAWVDASVVRAEHEVTVCQCEAVTARDVLEVRPPRYLAAGDDRRNDRSLAALLGSAPPHPDQVKRLTRGSMGLCQGRRCREQIAALLALGAGVPLDAIPRASHRAPVRPVPLSVLAEPAENEAMRAGWDTWFGMTSQYAPPWDVPADYTADSRDRTGQGTAE